MPFVSSTYLETVSDEKRRMLLSSHVPLGYHPETRDTLMLADTDRYAGMYILGVQGSGKSGLLQNLIRADIEAGRAVIVIDPHGDLTTDCIAQLPDRKLSLTYLLDMEDEAYPFGLNVFGNHKARTSVDQARAVDRLMHIFEVLWPDVLSQQHLPRYVRAATIVFLSNPGATLVDMHAFLLDSQVRAGMLRAVTDPTVRQFWQWQYDDLKPEARLQRVQPLIGRLEALFMGRSLVRNIVGQRQTTINFRQAIENKEVIFLRLPVKTLTQDARLVGTLLVAQIHRAIFSFTDTPERKRPGVSLYVDEFQHFATPDFSELFTEGRKFGVKVTVAHQYRGQLPSFLQDSTMTARVAVCFQTTPEDGRELAHLFPAPAEGIQSETIATHASDELRARCADYPPVVQTFVDWYLLPLRDYRRGYQVEIRDPGVSIVDMINGGRSPNPRAPDPIESLDGLLYEVMHSGDPAVYIPARAVWGFANCGRGFYKQVRGLADGDSILSPQIRFPPALVVPTANGRRWTHQPEDGTEQLYHFIFHLRMVMQHLAGNPIGKPHQPGAADVARMLTSLPRRAAFVHAGDTIGVIYTHDTPERLNNTDLRKRAAAIVLQTRQHYCHPRNEVERMLTQPAGNPGKNRPPGNPGQAQPPVPRWEEVEE